MHNIHTWPNMVSFRSKLPTKQKAEYGSYAFYTFKKLKWITAMELQLLKVQGKRYA